MANLLKMAKVHAIIGLLEQHWSYRRIAKELRVDRETVSRYDRLRRERNSNPAIASPGSKPADSPNPAISTTGSSTPDPSKPAIASPALEPADNPNPAIPAPGFEGSSLPDLVFPVSGRSSGRPSQCEPLREVVKAKLGEGLSAQRIFQDLRGEYGFSGSYSSVKRFVQRLVATCP